MTTTADILRGLPYFADLGEQLLQTVCELSEQIEVDEGVMVISEGSTSEEMYVLIEGELVVTKQQEPRDVELARIGPGQVVGELALLDRAPRIASVTATRPSRLVRVPAEAFEALLEDSRVVRRMVGTVTSRLRSTEQVLRHEERMAALGRMAAQLMHELNNPAAAVGRSSQEMAQVYEALNVEIAALIPALDESAEVKPDPTVQRTGLDRLRSEEEVETWLSDHAVADPWDLAPSLVGSGWSPELLEKLAGSLDSQLAPHWIRLIALRASAGQLIHEIAIGASRISELVRVVKHYSFLDQGPIQELVITSGIDDTLILLRHKLRGIEVIRNYHSDLANVVAAGRDLNQVWTNLIDNAADAMENGGTLTIAAKNDENSVVVSVADTGTGIPPEVAERIFDPFFTTKEPGKGTGLGLHTASTILSRAGGTISVASNGSGTTFTVTLPAAQS